MPQSCLRIATVAPAAERLAGASSGQLLTARGFAGLGCRELLEVSASKATVVCP